MDSLTIVFTSIANSNAKYVFAPCVTMRRNILYVKHVRIRMLAHIVFVLYQPWVTPTAFHSHWMVWQQNWGEASRQKVGVWGDYDNDGKDEPPAHLVSTMPPAQLDQWSSLFDWWSKFLLSLFAADSFMRLCLIKSIHLQWKPGLQIQESLTSCGTGQLDCWFALSCLTSFFFGIVWVDFRDMFLCDICLLGQQK